MAATVRGGLHHVTHPRPLDGSLTCRRLTNDGQLRVNPGSRPRPVLLISRHKNRTGFRNLGALRVLYGVSLPEAHDPIDEELGNVGIDFDDGSPARAAKLQVLQGFNEL